MVIGVLTRVVTSTHPYLVLGPGRQTRQGERSFPAARVGVASLRLVFSLPTQIVLVRRRPGNPVVRGGRVSRFPGHRQFPLGVAGQGKPSDGAVSGRFRRSRGLRRRFRRSRGREFRRGLRRAGKRYGGLLPWATPLRTGITIVEVTRAHPYLVLGPGRQTRHRVGPGRAIGVGIAPVILVCIPPARVALARGCPGNPVVRGLRVGRLPGNHQFPGGIAVEDQPGNAALLFLRHQPDRWQTHQQQRHHHQNRQHNSLS